MTMYQSYIRINGVFKERGPPHKTIEAALREISIASGLRFDISYKAGNIPPWAKIVQMQIGGQL